MKKLIALSILSLGMNSFIFSQITITSSDVLNLIGKTFSQEEEVTEDLSIMPGPTGPSQTWDFTTVDFDTSVLVTFTFLEPANTPYSNSFPEANFVQKVEFDSLEGTEVEDLFTVFTYSKLSDTEFITFGGVTESSIFGTDTSLFFTSNDTITVFPLTYQKEWTQIEIDSLDLGNGLLSVTSDTTYNFVDGYGTVAIPAGTFECLRLRQETSSSSKTILNGVELPEDKGSSISYTWLSKEAFTVASMSSLEMEDNPNFTMASSFGRLVSLGDAPVDTTGTDTTMNPVDTTMMDTTVMDTTGMDTTTTSTQSLLEVVDNVSLGPNPATGYIQLNFHLPQSRELNIEILDLQGRRVDLLLRGTHNPGIYLIQWQGEASSGSFVPDGHYLLLMRSGDRVYTEKFLWRN